MQNLQDTSGPFHHRLADHYDTKLKIHGDTALGADWPDQADRETRFNVMLDLFREDPSASIELLDFACGSGDLLRHIQSSGASNLHYKGTDISEHAIGLARAKFPSHSFSQIDILTATEPQVLAMSADYGVINGLFTVRAGMAEDEMWRFMESVIARLWPILKRGLAFNVMSKQVDWERPDLFHVPMDRLAMLMHAIAGRNIVLRADYGLYEYTCYAYKESAIRSGRSRPLVDVPPPFSPTGVDAVCRPLLPPAPKLESRLESIDRSRWYSNWGPLTQELEGGIADLLSLDRRQCVTANSGTSAITAAILALAGRASPARPYCLMPSYTFVATAIAALNAGYTPYLVDVDSETFATDPTALLGHPALADVGVVVPVAPYGSVVDAPAWSRFSAESGVAVVIDAAASLDSFASGTSVLDDKTPVVISLHATKVFGVGEGGVILCRDAELVKACKRALNFGFLGDRVARTDGVNGKMSEYHAAVGLAELDGWLDKRADFLRVTQAYANAAQGCHLEGRVVVERDCATGYALYLADTLDAAARARYRLHKAGVDHRLWYGEGLHRQPAYAKCPMDALPVTNLLAPRLIGLPCSMDLPDSSIAQVVMILANDS